MLELGMKVKNKQGKIGVVVSDLMNCCTDDETPIEYEGTKTFCGTQTQELEELGPVNPIPDFEKCGAGKEELCCIFLTMGAQGFSCERFSSLRNSLIFKTMNAKRQPSEPYPECMNQGG